MPLSRTVYDAAVSRWAPGARDRLEMAALDLFIENGYEQTTVAQIADRAGLNRATFFRHFTDKREVVLAGEDILVDVFAQAIRAADPDATLAGCLQAALTGVGHVMTPQRHRAAARRVVVVAANTELQERGQLKRAHLATSIAEALGERTDDGLAIQLATEVCMLAFRIALQRWLRSDQDLPFTPIALGAFRELQAAANNLTASSTEGRN